MARKVGTVAVVLALGVVMLGCRSNKKEGGDAGEGGSYQMAVQWDGPACDPQILHGQRGVKVTVRGQATDLHVALYDANGKNLSPDGWDIKADDMRMSNVGEVTCQVCYFEKQGHSIGESKEGPFTVMLRKKGEDTILARKTFTVKGNDTVGWTVGE